MTWLAIDHPIRNGERTSPKKQHKHTQQQPDILFTPLMLLVAAAVMKEWLLVNVRIPYPHMGIIGHTDYGHQLY